MTRLLPLLMVLALSFQAAEAITPPAAFATNQQTFQVQGIVMGIETSGKAVQIRHEAIPGYMGAMTMPFVVKDTNELAGLTTGDVVNFRLTVTKTDGWIDQVHKQALPINNLPVDVPVHISRDVKPLKEGDLVPDFSFTNELGNRIHLEQYRGGPLALTFLFTRCPFPTYCPLMANNFAEAQAKLAAATNAPAQWHLLTISFDPEFDRPAVLLAYARGHNYDPAHWSFATGNLMDISAFGDLFGLQFWKEADGTVSHNLRTIVIDGDGRIRNIYVGNQWTGNELARDLLDAAGPPPGS